MTMKNDQVLALYRMMQLIRQTEEQIARYCQRGLVHGPCHTCVGQEAIATGVCANLGIEDVIFSTHRGHGHALAKGLATEKLIAEILGHESGVSGGRGGSMHLFAPEIGLMGTSGIVGPGILQACGGGYSFKILGEENVAVAFFGDGAVTNAAFHEGLNMAGIWNLPVIFVCENNKFATEVPFEYASAVSDVGRRAANYGLPGFEIDGNDVVAVFETVREAVTRARAGGGAALVECKTYRTRAHAEGMGDFTYRSRDDVDEWKQRCPIARLRRALLSGQLAADDEVQNREWEVEQIERQLDKIDSEVAQQLLAACRSAEFSCFPDTSTVTHHVYAASRDDSVSAACCLLPVGPVKTFTSATLEALDQAMAENPGIFVMGEGVGVRGGNFGTTAGLYDKYGADRLCDTPICERGFVGLGCGAAMTGTRPVIDFMYVDFINDAFGEIVNQIAKMQYLSSGRLKMPILLRGCVGIGQSAAAHHSGLPHSIYTHIPGLRVVIPSTPYDAKGLMAHALRCSDPVLFLEHRQLIATKGPVPEEHYDIPFGRAQVVREGTDVTVVAISLMVQRALDAAEQLAFEDVSVEIVDPRTVSPLDVDSILRSVEKTRRLVVVDEAFGPCSVASEIAAQVCDAGFHDLEAPIKRLNGAFTPPPYSPVLEQVVVPQVDEVKNSIRNLLVE